VYGGKESGFWLTPGLLLPLVVIGGIVLGLSFQTQLELSADSVSSWVAVLVTVPASIASVNERDKP
tara:strand:- start:482 stop:679 length:198 start_codon:yes stop_codon:yes gene_type:complete